MIYEIFHNWFSLGFKWQQQLVFRSKLTMHTAYDRKDNSEPASITSLAVSKDHRTLYVGELSCENLKVTREVIKKLLCRRRKRTSVLMERSWAAWPRNGWSLVEGRSRRAVRWLPYQVNLNTPISLHFLTFSHHPDSQSTSDVITVATAVSSSATSAAASSRRYRVFASWSRCASVNRATRNSNIHRHRSTTINFTFRGTQDGFRIWFQRFFYLHHRLAIRISIWPYLLTTHAADDASPHLSELRAEKETENRFY